jgi:hypothetical protein
MMTTLFLMGSGVTAPTKREEIIQRIVAKMPRRGHSSAVNMVDVKILGSTTALAGEVIALQGRLPVTSKVVIVLSFSDVLTSIRVLLKRFACLFGAAFLHARLTVLLRSRTVGEISSAINALQNGANSDSPFLFSQLAKVKNILLLPIHGAAGFAALLSRSGGLVEHFTHDALALFETIPGLAMGRQGARLAPLKIRGSLRHLSAAIRTIKDSVFPRFHSLSYELSPL